MNLSALNAQEYWLWPVLVFGVAPLMVCYVWAWAVATRPTLKTLLGLSWKALCLASFGALMFRLFQALLAVHPELQIVAAVAICAVARTVFELLQGAVVRVRSAAANRTTP